MKSYKDSKVNTDNLSQTAETATAEELAQKLAKAYNGRSNMAMLQNILKEAERSKRAGTLSNEEIEAFYQSFSPMLNPSQRKQLRVIVDKLKAIE
jgi:DNA replication protein DnaD